MPQPEFNPKLGHMGFVGDKVALWQVFSKYFGYLCHFSFFPMLHTHLRLVQQANY
jgi:hypothetical protein